jgi:hypothetical protein
MSDDLVSRLRDVAEVVSNGDELCEEAAAEIERLRADAERWQALYRRAINEANGLTNYVEDRPELRRAERKLEAIESEARATKGTT